MKERAFQKSKLKIIIAVAWLAATLSLAGWWLIFGLQQVDRISEILNSESVQEIARRHRMLMSEGAFLFALLLAGGLALIYLLSVEMKRSRQISEFFATFTHDLKTSLASLRLQAETLEEDLKDSPENARITRRLVKDTVRLELQLDNSLFVADTEMGHLHVTDVSIRQTLNGLRHYWPELKIQMQDECVVRADVRALESILKNLLQNAVVHGKATHVEVSCETLDGGERVSLELMDNGKGFGGDPRKLGQMFVRHTTSSGSGIGLYLARRLAQEMEGELKFIPNDVTNPHGFRTRLELFGRKG